MSEGADDEDEESKTEDASPQRIEHALAEGDLPLSHDLIGVASMVLGLIVLAGVLPLLMSALVMTFRSMETMTRTQSPALLFQSMRGLALPTIGVFVAGGLGALVASLGQTGGRIFPDKLSPDFSRLMSFSAVVRPFTREGAADILLSTLKLVVVTAAIILPSTDEILTLTRLVLLPADAQPGAIGSLMWPVMMRGGLVLVVVGALDLGLQRYRWFEKKKMTKEELKREMKSDEGDPQIKGRRRQIHRSMVKKNNPTKATPRADAVIVNPTHIAIAIRYRKGESRAPIVIAKGKGVLADTIRAIAREHQIPIVKDIPLARLLHKKCEIGHEVPLETFKAVAAVLAFVAKITGRPPGTGP